jgi:hypothetical protein
VFSTVEILRADDLPSLVAPADLSARRHHRCQLATTNDAGARAPQRSRDGADGSDDHV